MAGLSQYLAEEIGRLDESLTAEELARYAVDREKLIESIEALCGNTTATSFTRYHFMRQMASKYPVLADAKKTDRDILEDFLDDCLSRLLVSEIPRMVSRALELEPMSIEQSPGADENAYLREATRCYLYGLFNASVALSRSALEQTFASKIPKLLQGASGEDTLLTRINTARSSILKHKPEICDRAHGVRKKANDIVHGKTCKGPEALRVLKDTRDIIVSLYGNSR
jgi:hypothetical protein